VGYATNGHLVIDDLIIRNEKMDKIFLFTDCQLYGQMHIERSWKDYKKLFPSAKLYIFDLAGYGHAPLKIEQNGVFLISGWSDKIFEMLDAVENGDQVIEKIKNYSFGVPQE
jgi:hypothetical protein